MSKSAYGQDEDWERPIDIGIEELGGNLDTTWFPADMHVVMKSRSELGARENRRWNKVVSTSNSFSAIALFWRVADKWSDKGDFNRRFWGISLPLNVDVKKHCRYSCTETVGRERCRYREVGRRRITELEVECNNSSLDARGEQCLLEMWPPCTHWFSWTSTWKRKIKPRNNCCRWVVCSLLLKVKPKFYLFVCLFPYCFMHLWMGPPPNLLLPLPFLLEKFRRFILGIAVDFFLFYFIIEVI